MSYGTPTPNTNSSGYQISANHTNGTTVSLTKPGTSPWPGAPGPAEWDEAYQAALDLFTASPDFTVTVAEKSYPTTEEITPTTP